MAKRCCQKLMRHVTVDLSCRARISRQAGATQTGQRLRMDYTMDNEEREEWKRKKLDIHYYRKVGRSHTRLLILRKPRPTTPAQKNHHNECQRSVYRQCEKTCTDKHKSQTLLLQKLPPNANDRDITPRNLQDNFDSNHAVRSKGAESAHEH